MNNGTRKVIATMTDNELDTAISRDNERLGNLGKNLKRTIGVSIAKRLSALTDERQARMLDGHAHY
tara:strand:+ start:1058 stop:1255 length:198 start_codon:yes stop_codon:yes gene_type:complete